MAVGCGGISLDVGGKTDPQPVITGLVVHGRAEVYRRAVVAQRQGGGNRADGPFRAASMAIGGYGDR
jgi:hypothetical protein